MINKIVSDGRAGINRAALDIAIKFDILYGGWITKARKTEDGNLYKKYKLKEIPASSNLDPIEKNVLASDGTLIICFGESVGNSIMIKNMAEKYNRPCLLVDLYTANDFFTAQSISAWINEHDIEVLNISGSEQSEDPQVYKTTAKILETVLYLDMMGFSMRAADHAQKKWPKSVDDASKFLISRLSLRDKAILANMKQEELSSVHTTLADFINDNFGLREGNEELIASCRSVAGNNRIQDEDAALIIIRDLWEKLRRTHRLRIVK